MINKLKEICSTIKEYNKLKKNELFWNNKWPKNKIIYSAQDGLNRDVRNLIVTKSYILERTAVRWKGLEPQEIAYKAICWTIDNLRYVGDMITHKATEYWQNPEETYQTKRGDCEDGALLITSLMRIAGCPAYRIKICAGWVKDGDSKGGHAYTIFLRDDNTWCVLDWCYWKNKKPIAERPQHKDKPNYLDIWWTFSDEYTWAQKNTVV